MSTLGGFRESLSEIGRAPELSGALLGPGDPFYVLRSIEARRIGLGLSMEMLAGRAGLSSGYYRNALAGAREISSAAIGRLREALDGKAAAAPLPAPAPDARTLRAIYEAFFLAGCEIAGVSATAARAADPAKGAAGGPDAVKAGLARRIAIYALRAAFALKGPAIAALLGVSKSAVSQAIQAIEDRREQPVFAAALDAAMTRILGE